MKCYDRVLYECRSTQNRTERKLNEKNPSPCLSTATRPFMIDSNEKKDKNAAVIIPEEAFLCNDIGVIV